jgi:hypothetical protein
VLIGELSYPIAQLANQLALSFTLPTWREVSLANDLAGMA